MKGAYRLCCWCYDRKTLGHFSTQSVSAVSYDLVLGVAYPHELTIPIEVERAERVALRFPHFMRRRYRHALSSENFLLFARPMSVAVLHNVNRRPPRRDDRPSIAPYH